MIDIDSDGPAESFETASKDETESNASFLSILDEKNKVIDILQQQLANQKLQIMYYMKKELNCTKIVDLSNTCSPENLEDNLPIVLSLEHFRKENGMKSNLFRLYEYMEGLDEKLHKSLNCQEYILRKIIEEFCIAMKKQSKVKINFNVSQPNQQNICVDLFNNLLDATVSLRKKLDSFRICCNRLLLIEDERNNLIEQVVTLPADEKYHCNFLMSIKHDKIQLEKKIQMLTRNQKFNNADMQELGDIEKNLSKIKNDLKASVIDIGEFANVGDMVRNLNFEANCLLKMTKDHQFLCNKNSYKLYSRVIKCIKTAFTGDEINDSEYNKDELEIIETIKKEIEAYNDKTNTDVQNLKDRLNETIIEKNKLKIGNIYLKSCVETLQKNYTSDIFALKQQKNTLEAQIEDLEELRKSYTELITMPNAENSDKEKELTEKIKHLEKKLQLMKQIIQKQNKEIAVQSEFIENLKGQSDKKQNNSLKHINSTNDNKKDSNDLTANEIKDLLISELISSNEDNKTLLDDDTKASDNIGNSFVVLLKNTEVKEVIKDVVQSILKDTNNNSTMSSYSLQIKCSCKNGSLKPACVCNNESELMRDCSNESLGIFCRPVQKDKDSANFAEAAYSPVESGYSRNIEVLVQNNRLKNSSSEECNI